MSGGRSHAIAAALFVAASVLVFHELVRDATTHVAVTEIDGAHRGTRRADAVFEAWLVARNARTLATRPHRLFDAEHCAPAENTLTLGIPMITQGVLALPAAAFSREPVLVYNASIVLQALVAAFAMYALVARWTGVPAAGWIAGLLFGFQPLRLGHVMHPSVWDIAWTVLALLFAERLFARGRWRDAVGLGAAIALQIGASFYPLLAATLLAPGVILWLALHHGLARVGVAKLAAVGAMGLLAASLVLVPYLSAETEGGGLGRTLFHYLDGAPLVDPGSPFFPGFVLLGLAAASVASGRRGRADGIDADPRLALLAGGALAALVAAGSNPSRWLAAVASPELAAWVPNLHTALATVVPGLDAVRGIQRLVTGTHLALTVVAGLGAGFLIRAAGRRGPWVAVALLALTALDLFRLPALGLEPAYRWRLERARPSEEAIAFHAELARRGSRGPLLEVPLSEGPYRIAAAPEQILLNAFHGRRTSACFASYQAAGRERLAALVEALPRVDAIRALSDLGFTTLIVHLEPTEPDSLRLAVALETAALTTPELVPLHAAGDRVAYRFEVASSSAASEVGRGAPPR